MTNRTYRELIKRKTFRARYEYLKLNGRVGEDTFGFDRHLNQRLYRSARWRSVRDKVIVRDEACDLGVVGYDIPGILIVHHMNPITVEDIELGRDVVFDTETLICTSHRTHQAIHYGDESLLPKPLVERYPGDTTLW